MVPLGPCFRHLLSPRRRPGSPRQGRAGGAGACCPPRADGRRGRGATASGSAGSGRRRSPPGGGRRLRSLGRLSRGCCRLAAAATAPAAPSAGGGDARAPGCSGRARLRARLLEAEVTPGLPRLAGRPPLRPLAAGTCLCRKLASQLPMPLPALPLHLVTQPAGRAHPPRPRPPTFPAQDSVRALWGVRVCVCVCVCVRARNLLFSFLEKRQSPESLSLVRFARWVCVCVCVCVRARACVCIVFSLFVSSHPAHPRSITTTCPGAWHLVGTQEIPSQ